MNDMDWFLVSLGCIIVMFVALFKILSIVGDWCERYFDDFH